MLFYEFNENAGQTVTDYQGGHIGTLGISQSDQVNDPSWSTVKNKIFICSEQLSYVNIRIIRMDCISVEQALYL